MYPVPTTCPPRGAFGVGSEPSVPPQHMAFLFSSHRRIPGIGERSGMRTTRPMAKCGDVVERLD